MPPLVMNMPRFVLAALAAGVWVEVGGILMAATFGYRDMKAAFDAIGLSIPQGLAPFIVHTVVRLILGAAVVGLLVIMARVFSPARAVLAAAGVVWLLAWVLPYAVVAAWGVFPWSLAAKLWAWSAPELLVAGLIGRQLYHPLVTAVG